MTLTTDLAHLIAAVVLAIAACVLALAHVAIPDFLPLSVAALLGISGGISIPTRRPTPGPTS